MKIKPCYLFVIVWIIVSMNIEAQTEACCDQGYPDPGTITALDIDGDGIVDFTYELIVLPGGNPAVHELLYLLSSSSNSSLLTPTQQRTYYGFGAAISQPPSVSITQVGPTDYTAYNGPGGWVYGYINDPGIWNSLTNAFVGFILTQSDGNHYGWLHMSRPDLKVKTPFAVVDYAYNPVPEAPIQAGIPAPPPVITTQKTPAGIQLAWPSAISGWTLQTTTDLGSNPVWQDYSTGTTNLLVPPTETLRYFRLVKP